MNPLLYNYYIDEHSSDKNKTKILCLLHELRIISRQQLLGFLSVNSEAAERTVDGTLYYLKEEKLIQSIKEGRLTVYFLTQEGHNRIGGYYTLPKVPEYNLNHHLQINDYLITMLRLGGNHPHLKWVQSERRQVYETKDMANTRRRKKYFVADFIFRFRNKKKEEVNWSFEIELTMKTRRRYRDGIFPKYINELKKKKNARLIYVTPSPLIKEELEKFRRYFIQKEGKEYEEIFDRLHVLSAEEFEPAMKQLLKEDTYINWREED